MNNIGVGLALKVLILGAVIIGFTLVYNNTSKPNYVSSFNVSAENIAKDMDGKVVQLRYGQMWPFDPTQSLSVNVVAKKQVDETVVVLVDVRAFAEVPAPPKDTKDSKDIKAVFSKVKLSGYAKLTYESIGRHWNLLSVDSVSGDDGLRASPAD